MAKDDTAARPKHLTIFDDAGDYYGNDDAYVDDDDWNGRDAMCSTCQGTGTVNPLTAPPGFVAVTITTCPHCEGTGRDD